MVNQKLTIAAEEKFFFQRVNYCIRLFERANMMFLFSTMKANVRRFVNRARWYGHNPYLVSAVIPVRRA